MHFQALLETLRFALLLWLPLWLLEATRPFDPGTLLVSPVSRAAWLHAGLIALFLSATFALVAFLMTSADEAASRVRASFAAVLVGSSVFLLTLEDVQRFAMDRSLAPHIGSLLALAVALMIAGIFAWLLCDGLPSGVRKTASLAANGVGFAVWSLSVVREIEPQGSFAHASTLALGFGAAGLTIAMRTRHDEDAAPRGSALLPAAAFVFSLLAAWAAADGGVRHEAAGPASAASSGRPNVLLVIVDTLRADHTDLAGSQADMTPGLARRAERRGTRFDAAWSAAPNTIPSMKALFTGQLSSHFGGETHIVKRLPLDATTLAEALRDAGYVTAGITANGLVSGEGFEQGFGTYWNLASHDQFIHSFFLNRVLAGQRVYRGFEWMERLRLHKERATAVTDLAIRWVKKLRSGGAEHPFFLYLHLLDPHWPYHDRGMGAVPEALSDLDAPFSHIDFLRLPPPHPDHARYAKDTRMLEMQGRYDDEIRAADRDLDAMLDALDEAGVLDDTLVVIAGDHGEEFFEHLAFGHGQDVYVEQLHVPLVFLWPADPRFDDMPGQVATPASLTDVLPTLHDLLGLDAAAGEAAPQGENALLGESLAPLLEADGVEQSRGAVVAESKDARGMRFVWRSGDRVVRFAYERDGEALSTEDVSVFDQRSDPQQLSPLDPNEPGVRDTIERARHDIRERGLR